MGSRSVKAWLMFDAVDGMNLHQNYVAELSAVPSCTMKWFNELSLAGTWTHAWRQPCCGGCNCAARRKGSDPRPRTAR